MPPSPVTKLFGTEDCKLQELLTDVAGETATYGTLLDVPGIKSVTMTPQLESKQLRGDNRELDNDTTLVAVEVVAAHAKLSFPVAAIVLGGAIDGTTGAFTRLGSHYCKPFRLQWRTPTNGGDEPGGDVHFEVTKLKVTGYPLGTAEEDYWTGSFTARGVFRLSDDKLWGITPHTSATAISA